jgi:hypothetical protein
MRQQTIGILTVIVIVLGIFFFKMYYPGSELELKHVGGKLDIPALVDYYKLSEADQCGIWYGDSRNEEEAVRGANEAALDCFDTAAIDCVSMGILAINESAVSKEYAFLRVVGNNANDQCVIQNSYYYKDDAIEKPETWINTCIRLDGKNLWRSCMPDFLRN